MFLRRLLPRLIIFAPILVFSQLCEPEYQVPLLMHVNSVNGEMESSDVSASVGSMAMTIGQPLIVNSSTDNSSYSSAQGFWSYYLTEPLPPVLTSSDGDYTDMVLLDWYIEDDLTGPPVTGDNSIIYRDGFALETVPIGQTQYLDFNVFPGTNYSYRVEVENELGSSQDGDNTGFLDPNGVVTGQILTASGNAVAGAKVTLVPNLGRSVNFEGNGYIYWYDVDSSSNLQFSGFEADYTIETWFRSVTLGSEQTIFAAVDSGTAGHYILLELTADGKVSWTHSGDGGENSQVTIESTDTYVAGGSPFYHLAVVFSSGTMTMYIDGSRVAMDDAGAGYIGTTVEMVIGKLGPSQHERYLIGYLDDFRIWSRAVGWTDIIDNRKMTQSGNEDGLAGYWKFDERDGEIVVDISIDSSGVDNNNDAATCDVERSENISPVHVGALTDTAGNYMIRDAYYGDGTTFTATPSQETITGRALEFDGDDMYVDFENQRIDLTGLFTIEGWFRVEEEQATTIFHAIDPSDTTTQVLVSLTSSGTVDFNYLGNTINGEESVVDNQWHHWAMTCDISTDTVKLLAYLNAVPDGSITQMDTNTITNLSRPFFGAYQGADQWFHGLMDDISVWDDTRTQAQISYDMSVVLTGDELGLRNYWKFNEGDSTVVSDDGGGLVTGEIIGMDNDDAWSIDIPLEEVYEHYYDPESRQVTLNYSNTSVDLVNFTDNSLIPVTGYVRYNNTSCVIEGAEILMNFESIVPPVYTDSEGKFTVDIEPGSSGDLLSVSYSDHEFTPAIIELPLLTVPLTGQYFDDLTTRTASGTVGGGTCRIPLGNDITVTLSAAVDGCIEEVVSVDSLGTWSSGDLPPILYDVSIYHPSQHIDSYFGIADTMSLEESDRTRNYTYYASSIVEFVDSSTTIAEGYDDDGLGDCDISVIDEIQNADAVLKQRFNYSVDFRVYQHYYGVDCDVDTFDIIFTNNISGDGGGVLDTASFALGEDEELPPYSFTAGYINLLTGGEHDYQRDITVDVTDKNGAHASDTLWAFVIGDEAIPNESFTVTSSAEPWYVLRVPPGDASYTEFSTEQEICRSNVITSASSFGTESEYTLHYGTEFELCTGFGVMVCNDSELEADVGTGFTQTSTVTDIDETEECLTVSNTYTASGGGLITGDDATVFIGGGKTISMGISYYLSLDDGCAITIDTVLSAGSSELSSVYMFDKYYIENTLIPNLHAEAQQGIDGAQEGYDYFTNLMDEDSLATLNAVDETVYSFAGDSTLTSLAFSAGASLDYNFTTDQSFTNTHTVTLESETDESTEGGFTYADFGFSAAVSANTSTESEEESSISESSGQTIGFHVEDDDIGDNFSFTMQRDPVWGMPVFKMVGGASSCPWEDGTDIRQGCTIMPASAEAYDIAPDEAAVFVLQLENTSETGEDQTYELSVLGETNLSGAVVTSSGVNLNENETIYMIESETYLEIDVSVTRGPTAYEYSGITLQLAPQCEDEIADAIGSGADPQNAGYAELSVSFIEPCSFSDITFPYDDWLVNGSHNGDTLNVTVGGYDLDTSSFSSLSLQYRQGGYGDFYPVETLDRDSLDALYVAGQDYAIIAWNISPEIIPDGSYELRTVVGCSGDDHDGVSEVVEGIIDRTGPDVLGLPSPTDGVLNLGDAISIEFNEEIDCEAIIMSNPDLALQNTWTGQWLDLEYTCGDNSITMVYPDGNQYIENQTLRAYVNNLYDLMGNAISDTIIWEFYVNNNPVGWVGSDITGITIYVDEEYSTTRQITNYGGSNYSWYAFGGRDESGNTLEIPEWLDVIPLSGTLEPGHSQDITISLTEGVGYGTYSTTIYVGVDSEGDEPLEIDIRKLCYEPDWTINPSDFQHSMNMTGILLKHLSEVVVDTSTDTYDMVGVFVGDQLRGVANVEYLPELEESLSNFHPYEVFLTIYSNESYGEDLSFKVWNASGCALLGQIEEDFVFYADSSFGSLTSPVTLTATSHVVLENALPSGWTWMSFNLVDDDMSVNTLLQSLEPDTNDIIKSHVSHAQYSASSGTWVGSLDSLDHQKAYLLRINDQDTMTTIGYVVDVELDTIDIVEGWNWIGYTPQESYSINDALGSLDSVETGDLIKNQYGFAEYLEDHGWFGSIDYMDPHLGYMLRASNNDILLYPFTIPQAQSQGIFNPHTAHPGQDMTGTRSDHQAQVREVVETAVNTTGENAPDWSVDPHEYSGSMSVTGMISVFGDLQGGSMDMVGAFINDTCRGMGQLKYVAPLEQYFVFMTIYGSDQDDGSAIVFQVYNGETDEVLFVPESLPFGVNDVAGSMADPFIWDARYLMIGDPGYIPDVFSLSQNYPNPFNPVTRIGYGIPEKCDVKITVYNILGEQVATIVDGSKDPGYYFTAWDSRNDMGSVVSSGIYLYQIQAKGFVQTRKLLLIK